ETNPGPILVYPALSVILKYPTAKLASEVLFQRSNRVSFDTCSASGSVLMYPVISNVQDLLPGNNLVTPASQSELISIVSVVPLNDLSVRQATRFQSYGEFVAE